MGEGEIGPPQPVEGRLRIGPALVPGPRQRRLEDGEPARRDIRQKVVAVAEMAIGRGPG